MAISVHCIFPYIKHPPVQSGRHTEVYCTIFGGFGDGWNGDIAWTTYCMARNFRGPTFSRNSPLKSNSWKILLTKNVQ